MDEARGPAPRRWHVVCALEEIADPGARGFALGRGDSLGAFLVRRGAKVFAYANLCPHEGRALNAGRDAFLTADAGLILCAAHGAVFEIETGLCVAGPCAGARLRRLAARVKGGLVEVAQA